MHTFQLQLVIGGLMLLATVQLAINRSLLNAYIDTYDTDATIEATSIGHAMADEAMGKHFDRYTASGKVYTTGGLTSAAGLGPDGMSESVKGTDNEPYRSAGSFNDFDDYNRYQRIVTSDHLGDFLVTDSVCYVQDANLDAQSASATWYKLITVTVTHKNLLRPVVVQSLRVYRRYH